jgi:endo-cleaving rubber dioxygenase
MGQLSRRQALIAAGAFGALVAAAPAQARAMVGWTWSPGDSVAGTGAGLDPFEVWDEVADPLLRSLLDRGAVPGVNDLLWNWETNEQPLPDGLPSDLRDFMEDARRMPSWADRDKLELAARFNTTHGLYLNLCNGPGGGMLACAIPKEARSVYYSAGGADMEDRVAKTSIFGFSVGSLDAFRPEGTCVVECVKTRLVHAAVRHLLPQSERWRESTDETVPINQEAMLVTWHTLPTFAMRKMQEWEVSISDDEAEAYLHAWQVAAYLLGISEEYIPATWEAAYEQSDLIMARNMGPTDEGVVLADTLLSQLAEQTSPGSISRPLCNALARFLVEDETADWIEVPRERRWDYLIPRLWPALVRFREGVIDRPAVPALAWTLEEAIRRYILFYLTKGEETKITIPTGNRPDN